MGCPYSEAAIQILQMCKTFSVNFYQKFLEELVKNFSKLSYILVVTLQFLYKSILEISAKYNTNMCENVFQRKTLSIMLGTHIKYL
jgi:hypothetical protein